MTALPLSPRRLLSALATLALLAATACASSPDYQAMTADEIFALGERAVEEEEWDRAVEAIERLLATHPGFDRRPEAHLLLGDAFFGDEEYITAASEYARLIDRYPSSVQARSAGLGICRSYAELSPIPQRDQSYTEQAANACANVVADFSGTSEAEEAEQIRVAMVEKLAEKVYLNGEFYLRRGFLDSAVLYFEDLVENYPDTPLAPRGLVRLIDIYGRIGYDDERDEARETLLDRYPDSAEARELREEPGGEGEGTAGGSGGGESETGGRALP